VFERVEIWGAIDGSVASMDTGLGHFGGVFSLAGVLGVDSQACFASLRGSDCGILENSLVYGFEI